MAYLFIQIITREVDIFKEVIWNTHRIRKQRDTLLPDGVPNHIYSFPEEYGLEECGKELFKLKLQSLCHVMCHTKSL